MKVSYAFVFDCVSGQWSIQPYPKTQSSMSLNIRRSSAACHGMISVPTVIKVKLEEDKKEAGLNCFSQPCLFPCYEELILSILLPNCSGFFLILVNEWSGAATNYVAIFGSINLILWKVMDEFLIAACWWFTNN